MLHKIFFGVFVAFFVGVGVLGQESIPGESLDILNLRSMPSGDLISSIPYDTPLFIDGRNAIGNWVLIHTSDNQKRGWVATRYVGWDSETYPLAEIPVVTESVVSEVPPQLSDLVSGSSGTVRVTLNVRSGPSKRNNIVKVLAAGTVVSIIDESNDWLYIQTFGGATQGWVSGRFVDRTTIATNQQSVTNFESSSPLMDSDEPSLIIVDMKGTGPQVAPVVEGVNTRHVNLTHYPDIEITLHWNSTLNLDLHVVDPLGYEIFPGSGPSPSGGYLHNPDNNDCSIANDAPIEVVTWNNKSSPPLGTYTITAQYVNTCNPEQENDTLFWVSVKNNGIEEEFWVFIIQPGESYRFTFAR